MKFQGLSESLRISKILFAFYACQVHGTSSDIKEYARHNA